MKIAPILRALDPYPEIRRTLIHTGQHYDKNLSDVFFEELQIQKPDVSLGIRGGTHGQQAGRILEQVEKVLMAGDAAGNRFDLVVVVGDVNSTMAAALAAAKLGIDVAHVEAGLRSRDRTMPEEINRIVTDTISNVLLCTEPAGVENLIAEGHSESRIHLVGNVMIDTLLTQLDRAKSQTTLRDLGLRPAGYAVVTLHRPSNVDNRDCLAPLVDALLREAARVPIVFPLHPRTRQRLEAFALLERLQDAAAVHVLEPLGYLDFLCLTSQAKVIVTDSGGLQDESTALGIPCLTMRENTERPITLDEGTSTLIGSSSEQLLKYLDQVVDGNYRQGRCPELWDGKAAERIVEVLVTG
jgi:UDP-N-acetylglucosamine 2-epimerase (non-hydrolysing)